MSVDFEQGLATSELLVSYQCIGDNLVQLDWNRCSLSEDEIETLFTQVFWAAVHRFDFNYADKLCKKAPQYDFVAAYRLLVEGCRQGLCPKKGTEQNPATRIAALEAAASHSYWNKNPRVRQSLVEAQEILLQANSAVQAN